MPIWRVKVHRMAFQRSGPIRRLGSNQILPSNGWHPSLGGLGCQFQGGDMEVRYLGFEQRQNARSYQFDVADKNEPARRFIVTVDLTLFHTHGIVIQEGPSLCASKLASDLERNFTGIHELTAEDLRSYANARSLAEAKRTDMRKHPRKHRSPTDEQSPWRGFRT